MKILNLIAKNIKALVAVSINPTGNMVQITGRNEAGKTSVLNAIWWAIDGAKHIQKMPIRDGENKAFIRLDLGDLIVERRFNRQEAGGFTTSLAVFSDKGARFPSPQAVLDELLSALSFDPLAFARSKPAEQYETLKGLIKDVDFDAIEAANKTDYDARTDFNRKAKEAEAAAATIILPPGDLTAVDEQALLAQIASAGAHNQKISDLKAGRVKAQEDMEQHLRNATQSLADAGRFREHAAAAEAAAMASRSQAMVLKTKLDTAKPLPEPIDTVAVAAALEAARKVNAQCALRDRKRQFEEAAVELQKQSAERTKAMDLREAEKRTAIAASNLPVPGLSLGHGIVLLNGLPFDQASGAVQLRTSLAIAMSMNPELRVLLVRDGSLLDSASLAIVEEMCKEKDFQIWIESVDESGKIGFVIEDGHVKAAM